MHLRRLALVIAAVAAVLFECYSQSYPTKPIRLIVASPPGGNSDLLTRLVAQSVGNALGQPMVVENRAGADGIIGTEFVARSAPDGYTLLLGNSSTIVSNIFFHKSLPYDPVKDFTPITGGVEAVKCIAVGASVPVDSIKELVDYAKRNPGKLTYGSSGSGGSYYLIGEAFKAITGTNIVHVPYKGLTPAMTDVVGGQIAAAFTSVTVALPHARSGRVKILAVVQNKRYAGLPDIPTLSELVPGFRAIGTWNGFFGRAGMPVPAVMRLNAEIIKAMNSPDVISKMDAAEFLGGTPEQFATYVRGQFEIYANIVKLLGIEPQ